VQNPEPPLLFLSVRPTERSEKMDIQWKPNVYENDRGIFAVFPELCKGCGLCIEKCPTDVIHWSKNLAFNGTTTVEPRMEGCIVCGMCQTVCPDTAISIYRHDGSNPPAAEPRMT
jgi:2-oxoglutarate ferredoxin oxidoreductase subunit delta